MLKQPEIPPATVPPDEAYRRVHAEERQPSQLPFIITSIALVAGLLFGIYFLLTSLSGSDTTPTTIPGIANVVVPDVAGRDPGRRSHRAPGPRVSRDSDR